MDYTTEALSDLQSPYYYCTFCNSKPRPHQYHPFKHYQYHSQIYFG